MLDRPVTAGKWIRRTPYRLWAVYAGAITAMMLSLWIEQRWRWTPEQTAYFWPYVRASVLATPYYLVEGSTLATTGSLPTRFAAASAIGDVVYGGRSLVVVLAPHGVIGLMALLVGLILAAPFEYAARIQRRRGRHLRGPMIQTSRQFTRAVRGDGIAITADVKIPRAAEQNHMCILGDSGSGKTSIMLSIAEQIRARGEAAIILDLKGDYLRRLWRHGDHVIDPTDARFPGYVLADDIRTDEEAMTLAAALMPHVWSENSFFIDTPKRILAYLMNRLDQHGRRPTVERLIEWIRDPNLLDAQIQGSLHAAALSAGAPAMREGVRATMAQIADSLAILPMTPTSGGWSPTTWAEQREGWVFIKSKQSTADRQQSTMSMWLDMLILRLLEGTSSTRKTWILCDELAALNKLPQFEKAVTQARAANVVIVFATQSKLQIEALYGEKHGGTILSQAATKLFLKTSEPSAARWISDSIGEREVETQRQSRSEGAQDRHTLAMDPPRRDHLVLPSQIIGLPPLHGVLTYAGNVTEISFPYSTLPDVVPSFVTRPMPAPAPPPVVITVGRIPHGALPSGPPPGWVF